MSIRFIDLFAGVGGFRLGIQKAHPDWECVYSNEWDKYANSVYKEHYGECDIRDIRKVDSSEIPEFDLLVGGFPCQSFSVAGRRGGFADTRGTLFFEIARIAKEKQPRLLLLENVKGLLSHDKGNTFRVILATLDELGYDVQWQVLNSKDFGVPQNRERVFIVGHLRGTPRPEVFPIGGVNPKTLEYVGGILSEKAKMWLDNGKTFSRNFPQGSRVYSENGLSATLASNAGGLGAKTGLYMIDDPSRKKGVVDKNMSPTLRRESHGNVPAVLVQVQGNNNESRKLKNVEKVGALKSTNQANPRSGGTTLVMSVLTPERKTKRQNGRRIKEDGEPSFTLTQQDRHGVLIIEPSNISRTVRAGGRGSTSEKHRWDIVNDGVRIRKLTPKECERLQGFPDDWTANGFAGEKISDTQRYKMMGNAVTTNVITAITERIKE